MCMIMLIIPLNNIVIHKHLCLIRFYSSVTFISFFIIAILFANTKNNYLLKSKFTLTTSLSVPILNGGPQVPTPEETIT